MILLTGSSGFLGKFIFRYLKGHDLKTLSRFSGDYKVRLDKIIPEFIDSFELIIHNAGLAHVSANEKNTHNFYRTNVLGTFNLLKGLEGTSIPKKFILISSVSVYGLDFGIGIDEDNRLRAKDPYGISKIQAEQLVLEWCAKNNVICTILRLPLVIGENPPGNLGSMINGIKKGFYFNISGGKAKKSMVLASDVAKYIVKASEIGGTYNLTDGYHPTFKELSVHISKQLGKKNPKNLNSYTAKFIALFGDFFGSKFPLNTQKLNKITADLTFDDTKARKAFGWNPTPVLEGYKLKK